MSDLCLNYLVKTITKTNLFKNLKQRYYVDSIFVKHNCFYLLLLLLYCLLCNVGLRHQNLSHLNKTHKKEKIIEKKINLYSIL